MEDALENSKESSNSAHDSGVTERMTFITVVNVWLELQDFCFQEQKYDYWPSWVKMTWVKILGIRMSLTFLATTWNKYYRRQTRQKYSRNMWINTNFLKHLTPDGKQRHHCKPRALKHVQRSLDTQTSINLPVESIKMVSTGAMSHQISNSEFSLKVSLV
jgi:hypothetical protein